MKEIIFRNIDNGDKIYYDSELDLQIYYYFQRNQLAIQYRDGIYKSLYFNGSLEECYSQCKRNNTILNEKYKNGYYFNLTTYNENKKSISYKEPSCWVYIVLFLCVLRFCGAEWTIFLIFALALYSSMSKK